MHLFIWCDVNGDSRTPCFGPGPYWRSCPDTSHSWSGLWWICETSGGKYTVSSQRWEGDVHIHWSWSCTVDAGPFPALLVLLDWLLQLCRGKLGFQGWHMFVSFPLDVLWRLTSLQCLQNKLTSESTNHSFSSLPDYIKPSWYWIDVGLQ